ncbi:hypothetical protein [Novacetimonas pomaceti]|uniref:hypothetical protein n=1 Tax=Novacetimonas pomaceti TaxID=2021998 RepID=UPI001EF0C4F6|nr:hypothetical protein [Novacetimonas pomaceti]
MRGQALPEKAEVISGNVRGREAFPQVPHDDWPYIPHIAYHKYAHGFFLPGSGDEK